MNVSDQKKRCRAQRTRLRPAGPARVRSRRGSGLNVAQAQGYRTRPFGCRPKDLRIRRAAPGARSPGERGPGMAAQGPEAGYVDCKTASQLARVNFRREDHSGGLQ